MTNEYLKTERVHNVAVITLDREGENHNTLSSDALESIEATLAKSFADPDIRGIVIESAKPDSFIVGADVEELQAFTRTEQPLQLSRRAHRMIRSVRAQRKPTVAAIHGPALGGGLELALACSYRIAARDAGTHFGLPEVLLGLIPGGGGTQLLPRLIGMQQALPIMLTGKNVYPEPALRMGLVDALTHRAGLRQAAIEAAGRLADGSLAPKGDVRSLAEKALESTTTTRRIIYRKAREQVHRETRGNLPAPLRLLDVVEVGMEDGLEKGLHAEASAFSELALSDVSKELVYLFFAQRRAQRNPWENDALPVNSIGILGGGLMGGGIAALSAERGLDVVLKDVSLAAAASAKRITYERASHKLKKRAISGFDRDGITERVRPVPDYDGLAYADLVIEAVPEDIAIKHDVLAATERVVREACVIASNTSSIPITRIAEGSKRPERILGMHYFSPVPQVPLLEVIRTPMNSDEVVATAVAAGLKQGKTVIVVNDGPGFYTTRILAMYMNEALLLLDEGSDIPSIDAAMKDFGFPMGPYELFDMVGIDVAAKIQAVLADFVTERGITSSDRASALAGIGIKGRKSNRGFYNYDRKREGDRPNKSGVNENVYAYFGGTDRAEIDTGDVQERLALIMINEAVLCLEEGVLNSPVDGDVGAVFGLGFPPFLGGPFRYIDRVGVAQFIERLETLRGRYGEQFRPASTLVDMAVDDRRFHA